MSYSGTFFEVFSLGGTGGHPVRSTFGFCQFPLLYEPTVRKHYREQCCSVDQTVGNSLERAPKEPVSPDGTGSRPNGIHTFLGGMGPTWPVP